MKTITEAEIFQAEAELYKLQFEQLQEFSQAKYNRLGYEIQDLNSATNWGGWFWFACFVGMVIFHWGYK
jgi:hypothetical protein